MIKRVGYGIGGGLLGGTFVGLAEAVWILSGSNTGEYVALVYAAVLYGLIGVWVGVAIGVGLALLGTLWKRLSAPTTWSLSLLGVICALGVVITRYIVNKTVYLEEGVPMRAMLGILVAFGVIFVVGMWLGPLFLKRTPLFALLRPRGTLAAYCSIVALAAVFSFAPARGSGNGVMAPDKPAGGELADKPNIILIAVDTLRADHLGTYGHAGGITPHIDAMASDGVVFEKAFTQASWTRPSFATLFTSMLPSSHTCETKVAVLPDQVTTLAEVLQKQGYATGGLPDNINVTRAFNFQQGFDYFEYQAPSYIAGATESAAQLSMYNVMRKVRDRLVGNARRVEDYYQPAEAVLKTARTYITANQEKKNRWFLWIHLMEPHDPYFEHPYDGRAVGRAWHPHPDPSEAEHLHQLYEGEVHHLDGQVGQFIDWLKRQELYDDTLIVLTSDHGEEFYEHHGWWHGVTLYDDVTRVPLILKLPKGELAGERVPWQVREMDIAPTLVAYAGADQPDDWQGRNLLDVEARQALAALDAPDRAKPWAPDDTSGEWSAGTAPAGAHARPPAPDLDELERVSLAQENFEGNVLSSIRSGGWKYIKANEGNPRGLEPQELYDLEQDPGEQRNLAGSNAQKVASLEQRMTDEIKNAASGVEGQTTELTCGECKNLLALGYMSDCSGPCGSE